MRFFIFSLLMSISIIGSAKTLSIRGEATYVNMSAKLGQKVISYPYLNTNSWKPWKFYIRFGEDVEAMGKAMCQVYGYKDGKISAVAKIKDFAQPEGQQFTYFDLVTKNLGAVIQADDTNKNLDVITELTCI